jgi:DNA replication protein DnaD
MAVVVVERWDGWFCSQQLIGSSYNENHLNIKCSFSYISAVLYEWIKAVLYGSTL